MLVILSPAKSLDFSEQSIIDNSTVFIISDNDVSIDMDYIQENNPLLLTKYNEFIDKTKIYKSILKLTIVGSVLRRNIATPLTF